MKRNLLSLLLALSLCAGLAAPALAAQVKDVDMVISEDGEITFEVEYELDAEEAEELLGDTGAELEPVESFTDVKESDWFYPYVMELSRRGMVNGVGGGKFNPQGTVTAAEFFALAVRLVMPERVNMASAQEYWAYPYYDTLVKAAMINTGTWGRSPELWTPSSSYNKPYGLKHEILRRHMAELLHSLANYMGEELTILPDIENNIPDSPKLSRQALWAYSAGIITGKTDGSFDPQGVMTRAEMCAVFCRLMEYTPRVQVVVQEVPQSDYFITTGDRKGMLKEEVGREYGQKALAGMFIGEDANGVYFSATAPVLPAEMQRCTVDYDVFVERPNGDFFVDHVGPSLTSGQSVKVYFNTFSNTPLRSSQIGSMRIYVSIHVPDYEDTITYLTDTSTSSQVLEIRTEPEGDYSTKIDLDVSHIFKGIGK